MKKETLEDFRNRIDVCDRKIAVLLSQRLETAREIGQSGLKSHVCDPDRERQVICNVRKASSPEFACFIEEIFKEIIRQSRKVQE